MRVKVNGEGGFGGGLGGYLGQKFERVSALVLAALTPHRGGGYLPRGI